MPRPPRFAEPGFAYHVLNRAVARLPLFRKAGDFEAFGRILLDGLARFPVRLHAYCVMPNHWHLVVTPDADDALSDFVGWLSLTHAQRWHAHHKTAGTGHLYQGRFKSFPIQDDDHFLTVGRYAERNALRAGLVSRAEDWRWGSLWHRVQPHDRFPRWLSDWPVLRPDNWVEHVNEPQTEAELEALRRCVARGLPFGDEAWVKGIEGRTRRR